MLRIATDIVPSLADRTSSITVGCLEVRSTETKTQTKKVRLTVPVQVEPCFKQWPEWEYLEFPSKVLQKRFLLFRENGLTFNLQ